MKTDYISTKMQYSFLLSDINSRKIVGNYSAGNCSAFFLDKHR